MSTNLTAKERIARLEELLARVQQRASQARPAPVAAAPPRVSEPPAHPSTIPPVTTVDAYADMDADVDIEVSTEVVDIEVDMDEMGEPLESGAQPVAEVSYAYEADDTIGTETTVAEVPEEPAVAQAPANEIEEPAPSSSPRPIGSEKPEAFEEDSAPRHTPPPESGKQVAAVPSSPPARMSSAPPASLEGHTLIGGWREPGLGGPIIGQPGAGAPTGVRVPAPAAQPPAPLEPVTATRPTAPDRPLKPEVTRAELPAGVAKVASFEGAAPAFKPSTFGELLDASLSL
jgi:hypothetical protein